MWSTLTRKLQSCEFWKRSVYIATIVRSACRANLQLYPRIPSAYCVYDLFYNYIPSRSQITNRIDDQLWRQTHRSEVEAIWHKKNALVLDPQPCANHDGLPENFVELENDMILHRQLERDKRLARKDPSAYCADRCIATGNCDVLEDVFQLSAMEVMAFCHDCVLSDGEEECDIPPDMLEEGFAKLKP